MHKIKINKATHEFPSGWDEVTLRHFKEVIAIIEEYDEEEDAKLDEGEKMLREIEKKVRIVSALGGIDENLLMSASLESVARVWDSMEWVLVPPAKDKFTGFVNLPDGDRLFFNSNLDDTTYGQFVDVQEFMKEGFWKNSEKILAVYVREVEKIERDFSKWKGFLPENYPAKAVKVKKYDASTMNGRAEKLLECTMDQLYPIALFFWGFSTELLQKHTRRFSNSKATTKETKDNREGSGREPKGSEKDGEPTPPSRPSAEIPSGSLTASRR